MWKESFLMRWYFITAALSNQDAIKVTLFFINFFLFFLCFNRYGHMRYCTEEQEPNENENCGDNVPDTLPNEQSSDPLWGAVFVTYDGEKINPLCLYIDGHLA